MNGFFEFRDPSKTEGNKYMRRFFRQGKANISGSSAVRAISKTLGERGWNVWDRGWITFF